MTPATPYAQDLVDAIPVPLFFLDTEGRYIGANTAFTEFIGISDEELMAKGVYELIADGRSQYHKDVDAILLREGEVQPYEDEVLAGIRRYFVIFRKALIRDQAGDVAGIVTTMLDVTNLKTTQDELVASESQKKAILDGFPGIIALFDKNLSAIWVNDAVRQEISMPIGRMCHEIICKQKAQCDDCAIPRSIESGKVEVGLRRVETGDIDVPLYYEIIGTPVKNSHGEVESVIVIGRDVTERYRLERQLRHAQKMEAIGTLAGGIAHDFNNVLTPIMGYTEIIKLKMRQMGIDDDPTYEYLSEILTAGKRAEKLVDQILTFSRSSDKKDHPQYIHPIAKEIVKLLRSTLPPNIKIKEFIDEGCGPVILDPVQLQQVLINLCTNGADAIGNQPGTLTIEIKMAEQLGGEKTEWVELSVTDTGQGMSPEVRDRVFEPYFSTKDKTYGTGMGLALVHSIVTRNGGQVDVFSEERGGSRFRVLLPVAVRQTTMGTGGSAYELIDGKGRIMLVDDEAQVVQVIGELLRSIGYQVSGWTSAPSALEHFQENPQGYDLMVTDLTMPHMTGVELSAEIKRIRPDFPVVLITGYSDRLTREFAIKSGIDEYCMKPVSLRDLSRVVGVLLDPSAEGSS